MGQSGLATSFSTKQNVPESLEPNICLIIFPLLNVSQLKVVSQRNIGHSPFALTPGVHDFILEPASWSWYKERVGTWSNNSFTDSGLLEQISTTKDVSDYLWYTIR